MSLKIAYVLKMYPRFSETFIVNEILELERQGIDVRIYSLRKPDDGRFHASLARVKAGVVYVPQYPEMEPERIAAGHQIVQDAAPETYAAVRQYSEDRGHPYAVKRFLQAGYIAGHLLQHPVDAMHAHFASSATRVANLVERLIGVPYSFTAHAKDIYHEDVSPDSLRAKIRGARFVVTVSEFNRRHLQALMAENIAGEQGGDIRRLYNGIDLTAFRPNPRLRRSPNLILGVGRLVEKKGFDVLIRACALLQLWGVDFAVDIVGKGEQREALQALIDALGLTERVQLVGPMPQEVLRDAYQSAALFALPCVIGRDGNRDGLPTVLLEAMASGLPPVSTDLTGVPEIIDHGVNGVLVPPGDHVRLASALAELLADPAQRAALGTAARDKVEAVFDVRRNVTQLHAWLAEPADSGCRAYQAKETIVDAPYSPLIREQRA
jgi:glycosyltransferase involved in cell wall biosynthesis